MEKFKIVLFFSLLRSAISFLFFEKAKFNLKRNKKERCWSDMSIGKLCIMGAIPILSDRRKEVQGTPQAWNLLDEGAIPSLSEL